jgi:hypothetical protein
MIFPSSEPPEVSRETVLSEAMEEPVPVCSSPGRSPPLEVTLLSWVPEAVAAVVLVNGAVKPFCFETGSSFKLSRKSSGIGIG